MAVISYVCGPTHYYTGCLSTVYSPVSHNMLITQRQKKAKATCIIIFTMLQGCMYIHHHSEILHNNNYY